MRIMSFNCNGLRSACRKGFIAWFLEQNIDVLCLQEIRCAQEQMPWIDGYTAHACLGDRKGYSGVAFYFRKTPQRVWTLGDRWPLGQQEGRWIAAEFEHYSVASLYLPSGSHSEARQKEKMKALNDLTPLFASSILEADRPWIIAGDYNIAHTPMDLKNWKNNQKNSGFLPEERLWLDALQAMGWVDAFRALYPEEEAYSWWSSRSGARARNVGWRIDYFWMAPALLPLLSEVRMFRAPYFSDHAPIVATFKE